MAAPQEVADYIKEIDDNFIRAKENRVSRLDITWDKWSRDINIRMRQRQEQTEDPIKSLLIWCFMYWVNRSQLLELHFKHKLTKARQKRALVVEGENIKRIVMSGDPIGPPGQSEQIRTLLKDVKNRQA